METSAAPRAAGTVPVPDPHPFDAVPSEPEELIATQPWQRVRVYVWEVPVRVTHWVTVFCVVVLSVTGG